MSECPNCLTMGGHWIYCPKAPSELERDVDALQDWAGDLSIRLDEAEEEIERLQGLLKEPRAPLRRCDCKWSYK